MCPPSRPCADIPAYELVLPTETRVVVRGHKGDHGLQRPGWTFVRLAVGGSWMRACGPSRAKPKPLSPGTEGSTSGESSELLYGNWTQTRSTTSGQPNTNNFGLDGNE